MWQKMKGEHNLIHQKFKWKNIKCDKRWNATEDEFYNRWTMTKYE